MATNSELLDLLKDFRNEARENHDRLYAEVIDLKSDINDNIKSKLNQHENNFKWLSALGSIITGGTLFTWFNTQK